MLNLTVLCMLLEIAAQSEINQMKVPFSLSIEQNIVRFYIIVDDTKTVQISESFVKLDGQNNDSFLWQELSIVHH